jgi:hypothetical protein
MHRTRMHRRQGWCCAASFFSRVVVPFAILHLCPGGYAHATLARRGRTTWASDPNFERIDADLTRVDRLRNRVKKTNAFDRKKGSFGSQLQRVISGRFDEHGLYQCTGEERVEPSPTSRHRSRGFRPFEAVSRHFSQIKMLLDRLALGHSVTPVFNDFMELRSEQLEDKDVNHPSSAHKDEMANGTKRKQNQIANACLGLWVLVWVGFSAPTSL